MTLWVVFQDTDFCQSQWEERLYNAIVGVIYCFCFFNLKEGRSRARASAFYIVVITENFVFVAVYGLVVGTNGLCIGGFAIVGAGTLLGLSSMLLYYRLVKVLRYIHSPL